MFKTMPLRCRLRIHRYQDFPDPNPETGGLEKQGYRACLTCTKETDQTFYVLSSGRLRLPV
jgi:hypothetical protein